MKLSICIIGGGAGGLAALKVLKESEEYERGLWDITVYEARDDIGGIWYVFSNSTTTPLTPLYDSLTTNLPHPLMAFQSHHFPPETPLFPRASVVLEYLKSYASTFDLYPHIRLKTAVRNVRWVKETSKFEVELSDGLTRSFDKVIVANGHYSLPYFPPTPGLDKWLSAGKAMHSAWYRRASDHGRTVLVAGGGPSGRDITLEMKNRCTILIHSIPGSPSKDLDSVVKLRPAVTAFSDDGTVTFEDGSTYPNVDFAILGTGYQFSFPFLSSLLDDSLPPAPSEGKLLPDHLHNTRYSIYPLHHHIFPLLSSHLADTHDAPFPFGSLAFVGLSVRVIILPIEECQTRFISRVFRDPTSITPKAAYRDIQDRYRELSERGISMHKDYMKNWHRNMSGTETEQFAYRDQLLRFAYPDHMDDFPYKVEPWAPWANNDTLSLRAKWEHLEKTGEDKEWLKGVGYGDDPISEWVELMKKLAQSTTELDLKPPPSSETL
ncbi:FAD/NAD(P)-binding domain-containing protein [Sistotremastrum niveocremeum HHB9708]|uniref:FAD/NAD(P)-binding domain-containing protein n=1 Tax=Sistotremastrum niveocremeum HHB9708 TaxID=1314777 RepID=A0A164XVB7_9AGAM|nr:FAD/NAD(P)-binding domain-containing protein [Sistotremastrum niveocremeum HHB9708]